MGLARSSPTDRIDQVGSLEAGAAAARAFPAVACCCRGLLAAGHRITSIYRLARGLLHLQAIRPDLPLSEQVLSPSQKKKNTTLALSEESNNFKFDQILYKNLLIFMSPNIFLIKIYYMINVMILSL